MEMEQYFSELVRKEKELIILFGGREEGRVILSEIKKLIIYYGIMQKIPDDIWLYIFSFLSSVENIVLDLMRVSKTWQRCLSKTRELRFKRGWWTEKNFLRQFPLLTKLKVYHCQPLDFSLLINLRHLSVKGNSNGWGRSNNYHHLPLLTNLTSLSIKQNNHIPNGVFLRFPSSLRQSITSLNLNDRVNNNVLSIFTNLKKLNLSKSVNCMNYVFDVSHMKYLTELKPYHFHGMISMPIGFNGHMIVKESDFIIEYIVENGRTRETKRIIHDEKAYRYRLALEKFLFEKK